MSQEKIEALWSYADSPLFTEAERAALSLAQAGGSVPNQVEAVHFDALKAHYTDAEVVEITAIIAAFGFLNRWNDTLATTLEDGPLAFAQASLAASGWAAASWRCPACGFGCWTTRLERRRWWARHHLRRGSMAGKVTAQGS